MASTATVVKHTGSHYLLSELPRWEPFEAVLRGQLRLQSGSSTNPIAVGDRVEYEPCGQGPCAITKVLERKNHLIRKSVNLSRQNHIIAANIDRAFVVTSLYFPEVKLPFLDRILVTCEMFGIPATILLNKTDLYREEMPEAIEDFLRIYHSAGYEVIPCSVRTGEGIEEVRARCRENICLFCGDSGVGKSSLIQALDPTVELKTGAISTAHLQGRHTTTFYEMFPLNGGRDGFVIDSPGLRAFGLSGVEKEEIALYFPEMLRIGAECRYQPCTHTHEPGCAVKEALEKGEIAPERYQSYLGMLEEESKYRT